MSERSCVRRFSTLKVVLILRLEGMLLILAECGGTQQVVASLSSDVLTSGASLTLEALPFPGLPVSLR